MAEISYTRQYNNRALEHELKELEKMMDLYDRFYKDSDYSSDDEYEYEVEQYATQAEAEAKAKEMGGSGFHEHEEDGVMVYMPFSTHDEYEMRLEALNPGKDYVEKDGVREELRDRLRDRLEQLLSQSTTSNGL